MFCASELTLAEGFHVSHGRLCVRHRFSACVLSNGLLVSCELNSFFFFLEGQEIEMCFWF